jgi:hypothetical protein
MKGSTPEFVDLEDGPADFASDPSVWRCASLPGGNGRIRPAHVVPDPFWQLPESGRRVAGLGSALAAPCLRFSSRINESARLCHRRGLCVRRDSRLEAMMFAG